MGRKRIEQAGAVVFRSDGPETRVLLVQAKKAPHQWVFPKGHVEPGESSAEAALRESAEEAGVSGEIVTELTPALSFRSGDEDVRVRYHLVRMTGEVPSPESREKRWLGAEDAIETLSHEDAKSLLRGALELIRYDIMFLRLRAADPPLTRAGDFHELLLAEYAHTADSLLRNEEDGEKRAGFFLTVATGAAGVLTFALGKSFSLRPDEASPLVVLALVVVLALGYVTLTRLTHRNRTSDGYKEGLQRIRRFFLDGGHDPRRHFLAFDAFKPSARPLPSWRSTGRGGWLETVAMVEALAAGALAAMLTKTSSWWADGLIAAGFAALAWVVLMKRARAAMLEDR